jgi:hypothetical protein
LELLQRLKGAEAHKHVDKVQGELLPKEEEGASSVKSLLLLLVVAAKEIEHLLKVLMFVCGCRLVALICLLFVVLFR